MRRCPGRRAARARAMARSRYDRSGQSELGRGSPHAAGRPPGCPRCRRANRAAKLWQAGRLSRTPVARCRRRRGCARRGGAALADWPRNGVPDRPEAWLLTVARRKAIDSDRRRRHREEATSDLQLLTEELADSANPNEAAIPDHRLPLIFACAHPAIDERIRAPVMLQAVLGFDA